MERARAPDLSMNKTNEIIDIDIIVDTNLV